MFKSMIRATLLLIVTILLALPAMAQTGDIFTVSVSPLHARTGPGIEYPVVANLQRGGTYEILQYSMTENWVLLDLGYTQAWAFRHLGEVESIPAISFPDQVITTPSNTPIIVNPSLGQGGGFAAPTTNPVIVNPTTAGQGGGFAAPVNTDREVYPSINTTVGVTAELRIRVAPSLNARIITAIPLGQRPTPIGRNYNGTWIQLDYDGTVGWAYFLYISFPPAIDVRELPVTG